MLGTILAFTQAAGAAGLPDGLVFSGLAEGDWSLYVSDPDGPGIERVPTQSEARTPAVSPDGERVAYIGVRGALHEVDLGNASDRVLVDASPARGLTHPVYTDRERIVAVWLKDGKSVDTDLVVAGPDGEVDVLLAQRSAQFEPSPGNDDTLYYSSVACTVGCGRVIQEIWRYRLDSRRASQLTRLNAVSRQPYVGPRGALYFSSNATGHYRIWRLPADGGAARPVTGGAVVDSWPVVTADGTLYFLRRTASDVALMRLARGAGSPVPVELDREFDNLKDLRLNRCATHC